MAEQLICNQQVVGSTPTTSSNIMAYSVMVSTADFDSASNSSNLFTPATSGCISPLNIGYADISESAVKTPAWVNVGGSYDRR